MNSHGLTRENLVATLPPALQKDPSAVALAEAMADLLARRPEEIEQLRIYPVIDRLDERLLDILAYDFKVDWWDADYSLEEKRRTLKDSWRVHKTLGTKAAVETAIRAIYPLSTVEEWFEYGGEPYHFRVTINMAEQHWGEERPKEVLKRAAYYKSLRSHLDGVITVTDIGSDPVCVHSGLGACISITQLPKRDPPYNDIPAQVAAWVQGCFSAMLLPTEDPSYSNRPALISTAIGQKFSIQEIPKRYPVYQSSPAQVAAGVLGCFSTVGPPERKTGCTHGGAADGMLKSSLTITELPEIRRDEA